jgi:hypothetical protein
MAGNPYRQITMPDGRTMTVLANQAQDILAGAQADNSFSQSANAPIPGLTAPVGTGAQIPGLMNGRPAQPSNAPFQGLLSNNMGAALGQHMNNSYTPEQWRGLLPSSQQIPQMPPGQFQPQGPYGAQAMMDAGLLGQMPQQQPTIGGLLGGKGYRMPGIK